MASAVSAERLPPGTPAAMLRDVMPTNPSIRPGRPAMLRALLVLVAALLMAAPALGAPGHGMTADEPASVHDGHAPACAVVHDAGHACDGAGCASCALFTEAADGRDTPSAPPNPVREAGALPPDDPDSLFRPPRPLATA